MRIRPCDIRRQNRVTQVVPGLWTRDRRRGLQVLGPGLAWWHREEHKTPAGNVRKGLHWRAPTHPAQQSTPASAAPGSSPARLSPS